MSYKGRQGMAEEHKWTDPGQVIMLVVFLTTWILDSFLLKFTTFLTVYIHIYLRLVAAALCFLAWGSLMAPALRAVFGQALEKQQVIKTGVYSILRHPIYCASMFFFSALAVSTMSLASLFLLIPIFLFYNHVAKYEESKLIEKRGDEYGQYINETYRWVPFLKKIK